MAYYRIEVLEEVPHIDEPDPPPEMMKSDDKAMQARFKRDHDEAVARRKTEINRLNVERNNKVTIRQMQVKQRHEGFQIAIVRNDTNRAVCLCDGMTEANHIAQLLGDRPLV
jgi:hypothetical protein